MNHLTVSFFHNSSGNPYGPGRATPRHGNGSLAKMRRQIRNGENIKHMNKGDHETKTIIDNIQ